jgi:hypothetical protein
MTVDASGPVWDERPDRSLRPPTPVFQSLPGPEPLASET